MSPYRSDYRDEVVVKVDRLQTITGEIGYRVARGPTE